MYRKRDGNQLTMDDFIPAFGGKLSKENRWVKMADLMPWEMIEDIYIYEQAFKEENPDGRTPISARIAFGALYIKENENEKFLRKLGEGMDKVLLERLQDVLPVEPGINGKDEYTNCAVLVLLMWIDNEYHFVFEKRAANIRQPGDICFPGGKFDPKKDADFRETALRETTEELGVDIGKLKVIGRLDTVIAPMGTTADAFLGVIDVQSPDELQINRGEVAKVFTVPVSYFEDNDPGAYQINVTAHPTHINEDGEEVVNFPAKELGLPKRYTSSWPIAPYNIYAYRVAGETIWGMTARLVRSVIGRIRATKDNVDSCSEEKNNQVCSTDRTVAQR